MLPSGALTRITPNEPVLFGMVLPTTQRMPNEA